MCVNSCSFIIFSAHISNLEYLLSVDLNKVIFLGVCSVNHVCGSIVPRIWPLLRVHELFVSHGWYFIDTGSTVGVTWEYLGEGVTHFKFAVEA